jgi:hypothetical protein
MKSFSRRIALPLVGIAGIIIASDIDIVSAAFSMNLNLKSQSEEEREEESEDRNDSKQIDSEEIDSKKVDSKQIDSKKVDSKMLDSKITENKTTAEKNLELKCDWDSNMLVDPDGKQCMWTSPQRNISVLFIQEVWKCGLNLAQMFQCVEVHLMPSLGFKHMALKDDLYFPYESTFPLQWTNTRKRTKLVKASLLRVIAGGQGVYAKFGFQPKCLNFELVRASTENIPLQDVDCSEATMPNEENSSKVLVRERAKYWNKFLAEIQSERLDSDLQEYYSKTGFKNFDWDATELETFTELQERQTSKKLQTPTTGFASILENRQMTFKTAAENILAECKRAGSGSKEGAVGVAEGQPTPRFLEGEVKHLLSQFEKKMNTKFQQHPEEVEALLGQHHPEELRKEIRIQRVVSFPFDGSGGILLEAEIGNNKVEVAGVYEAL